MVVEDDNDNMLRTYIQVTFLLPDTDDPLKSAKKITKNLQAIGLTIMKLEGGTAVNVDEFLNSLQAEDDELGGDPIE